MILEFEAHAIEWRGPAPFVFVPVPADSSAEIRELAPLLTYGWGCIPATVQVGGTRTTTALFPKGELYLVPVKVAIQRAEGVAVGDLVRVRLELSPTGSTG